MSPRTSIARAARSSELPARPARPASCPSRHGHSTCSCARRCPKCQPLRLATRRSGPSVQASRPPFTAPGPSARHVLLGLHLAVGFRIRSSAPAQHEPRNTSLDTPQCASEHSRSNCTKEIENRMKMLPLTITHHNKLNTNGKCVRMISARIECSSL